MPRAKNADVFDVWGKPPPLLRTLTERQERALRRYVDKVVRIAYDCGVAAVTPEKKLQTTQEPTQEQIEAAARALKALAALPPEKKDR